jgi:UDPglucose 6-dehydrogenase
MSESEEDLRDLRNCQVQSFQRDYCSDHSPLPLVGPRNHLSPEVDLMANPLIAVVGTGYVGLTTGACLASIGHTVVCADIDPHKIARLEAGEIPIVEEGLGEIVAEARTRGLLRFVVGAAAAAADAEIVFLSVPTPQGEDGSADLSYIEAAATEIAQVLRPGAIVINKSTVPVGSTRVVERVIQRPDVHVVSNPEFLREGSAVHDFLHPDRIVIGADDPEVAQRVADLYQAIDTELVLTDPASAETIKYAANGFLAMKISFINAVAAMCEAVGADVAHVIRGIGSDSRIGSAFLNPGPGWGGSCFPKDSRALVQIAESHGYDFSMMRGVIEVNEEQRARMVDKVMRGLVTARADRPGSDDPPRVAVWGLTFKAGTDDLRESPALAITAALRERGVDVVGYDPTVPVDVSDHRCAVLAGIKIAPSALAAVRGVDLVMVATEWPEFRDVDLAAVVAAMRGTVMVDTRNLLDPERVRAVGLVYDGVGRR